VAQIGQRPLDPPIAPIPVLASQANDQIRDLMAGSRPTWPPALAAVILLGDQLSVPGQQGFWRDEGGHFPQDATAEHLCSCSQAATLIVVQSEAPSYESLPQYPVFLAEVLNGVTLLLAEPPGNRDQ
jgi:hypothetical protein